MFLDAMQTIASLDRPGAYYRVLFYCITVLDGDEERRLPVRRIMEATDLSRPSVERAMAMLIADNVLHRSGRGPGVEFRLSNRLVMRKEEAERLQSRG